MTSPLEPLWRLLREHPDPRHPDAGWRRHLGEDYALVATWLVASRGRAGTWECGVAGGVGCERRVVDHGDGRVVAVCGDHPPRCDRVELRSTALALRALDLAAVARAITTSSGLPEAKPDAHGRGHVLGPLRMGPARVVVLVTGEHAILGLLDAVDRLHRLHSPQRVLVLAPVAEREVKSTQAAFNRAGADLVPLSAAVQVEGDEVFADLSDWALSRASDLRDFDALPMLRRRFDVVLDPARDRFGMGGIWHDFNRKRLPFRLLVGLAKRAGELVTRDELFDEVWPGDDPAGNETWETNLRSHKRTLARMLGEDLIEGIEGDTYTGGYRLDVPASRVAWWSPPKE